MSENISPAHKLETIATGRLKVACSGPAFSKHPQVYLTMTDDAHGHPTSVVCPYCSRTFLYDSRHIAAASSGH